MCIKNISIYYFIFLECENDNCADDDIMIDSIEGTNILFIYTNIYRISQNNINKFNNSQI